MMKTSNGGSDIAHNVQIGVDDQENIVVGVDVVSNAYDYGQLTNVVAKAKKNMKLKEKDKIKVLADKGYNDGDDLVECEKIAEAYVARRSHPSSTKNRKYSIDNFTYLTESIFVQKDRSFPALVTQKQRLKYFVISMLVKIVLVKGNVQNLSLER